PRQRAAPRRHDRSAGGALRRSLSRVALDPRPLLLVARGPYHYRQPAARRARRAGGATRLLGRAAHRHRAVRPVGRRGRAAPAAVVFASDIGLYRERKLRLLNGAHTALAPLALLAGVATVREAAEHPRLGPLLERVLFQELVPGTDIASAPAREFAAGVMERF